MKPSFRTAALLASTVFSLAGSGCAAVRQQVAQEDTARDHVYRKPLAEVWPEALALIKDKGFSIKTLDERSREGFIAQTEWLLIGTPTSLGTTWARYSVTGVERVPGQSTVHFQRDERTQTREADGRNVYKNDVIQNAGLYPTTRDTDLEWELIQKVESATVAAK
ncbi:hypothetical protein D7X74_07870 [Corallococcus sp. CA047B]|uniref:hypothetical protein n=1 Tax=Corallococcus sp. CA047B TaxID=2316729 RepID=UPI000EA1474F|nr:hypothetical protein [Corallococcus sp. CA047B]RKH19064.1 hypothetical protein D7X74_07870 [Corallococcus sp. CA047B]